MLNKSFLGVLCLGLLLVGCGGSGGGLNGNQSPRVRLFNAADGEATLFAIFQDANLNNLGVSPHTAYGSASVDTLITNTNATATLEAGTGALVTTPAFLYRVNSYYTLYGYGSAFLGYHGLVLTDSELVAPGQTFGVRAVQLGSKNMNVDVYVQPGVTPLGGASLVFSGLGYSTVSSSTNTVQAVDTNGYVLLSQSGSTLYTVSITLNGSTTPIATTTVTARQGSYFTVVVYDSPVGSATQTSVAVLGDTRND